MTVNAHLTPGVLGSITDIGLDCRAAAGQSLTIASIPVRPASIRVTVTSAPVAFGTPARVAVAVTPPTGGGRVEVRAGTRALARATVRAGRAVVTLPRTALKPGTHDLVVAYTRQGGAAASTSVRVRVTKAKASVSAKVTTKKVVAKKTRAKVKVTVRASGFTPGGKVKVYAKGKKVGTATLGKNGKATVKLAKLKKAGTVTLKVTYLGSSTTTGKTVTVKVKVRKR